MKQPTDKQILEHIIPPENFCDKCAGDVKAVEYDDYRTYKCLVCEFEPTLPE